MHQFVWGLYLDELMVYDYDNDGDGDFDAVNGPGGDRRHYALSRAHALLMDHLVALVLAFTGS